MPQPTAPAPSPATTVQPAGLTRSDGVVSGNAPAPSVTGNATTGQPGAAAPAPQSQPPGLGSMGIFLLLPVFMIAMWWFGSRAEKKKRAELAATLAGLQRNDKVETIGGVIGRIAELNDNEVVLKVDEVTNSRICVNRRSIATVLNRAGGTGAKSEAKASA